MSLTWKEPKRICNKAHPGIQELYNGASNDYTQNGPGEIPNLQTKYITDNFHPGNTSNALNTKYLRSIRINESCDIDRYGRQIPQRYEQKWRMRHSEITSGKQNPKPILY